MIAFVPEIVLFMPRLLGFVQVAAAGRGVRSLTAPLAPAQYLPWTARNGPDVKAGSHQEDTAWAS